MSTEQPEQPRSAFRLQRGDGSYWNVCPDCDGTSYIESYIEPGTGNRVNVVCMMCDGEGGWVD